MTPRSPPPTGSAIRRPGITLARAASILAVTLAVGVATAGAQYPDAYTVSGGALRVSFEPELITYNTRFGLNGEKEPLGTDLTTDSAGSNLLPSLLGPELAVRTITGDATYQIDAGVFRTTLDADIRRLPFNLALGLTNRITLTASVPIVTTRMQVDVQIDNTNANAGWNQAAVESGNLDGRAQIEVLLAQLEAAAASVESQISSGAFGCPTSATCDQARDLVNRTRNLGSALVSLTGVSQENGGPVPPFAPLGTSAAGQAVTSAIASIAAELQGFGAAPITATLPLPTAGVTANDVNAVLTNSGFGYDALPLAFAKLKNQLGDIEVGMRFGLVEAPGFRTTLATTVRLPTGTVDSPEHFVDLGSGDGQTDVVGALEVAWEPSSSVALALFASYTLQLPHNLVRRITPPDRPIALAASEALVRRDLGDVVELAAYPTVRLSSALRAYVSARYLKKLEDRFTLPSGSIAPSGFPGEAPVESLDLESKMETASLGGGVYFRSTADRRSARLPIEAGIDYRAAFDGSGGLTPKASRVNFFLRLYYRLWGRMPESAVSP